MAVIGFSTSMLANTDVTYTEPSYTCDAGKDFDNLTLRYATEMSLTCGEYSDTWTHSGTREFYNVLSDFTIDAKAGETVTANFKANNPAYESKNSEDLRWTIATLHIDWNRDGNFESSEIIAGKTGDQMGTGNDIQRYYGNREYIFDITKDIVIPEGTTPGKVRVRLNYTNAWIGDESVSAFATKSKEGIVYDFDINIVEPEKVVTYLVSWAGETVMQGGYLKVVYADSREEVKSDETEVPEGSVLEIIPLPDKGYSLSALSYQAVDGTGASINIEEKPYTFTVGGGGPDMKYIIISAEFTPDTYTLSTSVTPENSGSVSVTDTKGTPVEGNLTYGQTIVITASANGGYTFESLDVKGATKVDGQENQYTVEGDVTVTATFVEDAPAETWTEVHFNSISGSKSNEIDLNNDPYYIYPEQTGTNTWNTTNSSGASETDNKFGPYIKTVSEGYYLAYRYEVEKKATYRFSFLHKKAGTVETTAKLCYTTDLSGTFTDASDVVALEKKAGNESGVLFQSNKIELEKGSYYFVYYIVSGGESKVRIADFKLEMLDGSAVEPAMPAITIMKPVNGNLTINYLNGEVMEEISTYEFEEDSKVYNIPENTVLSITANPEVGYVLDTILPEGMVEKTGKGGDTYYEYTVTGDATIEATFIEEEIQYGKVSVVEPLEAEGTIEIQLYNVLFGSWRPAADFFLESVEYGMQLRAKVDANEGYAIESVKKNDEIITANEEDGCYYFTVDAADIKISATFTKVGEKYAQNFGQGVGAPTGDAHRSWTNTVFKTSTDGTKTVEVNYETKQNSYEIYSDALVSEANKATVYLGEQFDLTINGGMNWLYTLVYIDWNGDGVFDETVDGKENLGFNPVVERDFGAGSTTNANVRTYKVKVPENATVGDTRVRIILGWKQTNLGIIPPAEADKELREMTSTTIDDKKNAMARDFSLCILDNQLDERTITLAVNDQSMGKAVITGTEDTSITTSDINVSVTAIPEEGYMFVNWTDAEGEILSTDNPYLYGGLESATITANFAVKTYPVMTRKYTTISQQNRYLKEVVATVGGEAQNLFTATTTSQLPLTEYTTEGEVTESGALIDKTDTPIVLEQGTTSFDMTFKAWTETFSVNNKTCSQQIIWTSQAIYVDWNNDMDFDDENECLGAVGTPATGNNFGDTDGSAEKGWTRTLNIPADVAAGTYRMRVVYNESSVTGWENTFFSAGKGNINAGVSYDFNIQIEGQVEPTPETVTLNKPVNGNISVTYNNGTDDVTVSTDDTTDPKTFDVAKGTKLTVTVTPDDGYQLETLSPDMTKVENSENVYEYTVTEPVTIEATFTEIPETDPIIGVGTDSAKAPVTSTADSPVWFVMKSSHLTVTDRQNRFMYWNESNNRLECTQHNDGIKLSEISDVYRWRFEDAGDGNVYIINKATGKALSVPANASSETGNDNVNTPLTLEETGSKWSFALSSTVNPTQALPNQYCFDYVDYAEADRAAYLNAMDGQAAIPYGITIYEMGVQNASGWFIYEAPAIVKNYDITVKKPVNGNLVISYTVNDEMQSIETYNFENDSEVFSIEEGTVLSISANPEFDYVLDQILPEGMEEKIGLAGDKYYEYTVTGDATIEATFKPVQYGKVSAETPEEGTIEIQLHNPMMNKWVAADEFFLEQVEFGTELRAKVEANTGYNLVSVMKNQEELSTEEEGYYYFTVDAEEITISAEFEAQTFTLTKEVTPAEGGSVSVTVNGVTVEGSVKYGDVITVTVTVNEGYLLESVVVEGAEEVEGQKDQYTVTGNITITATFKKDTSSINSIENGTVYYNAEEEVLYTGTAKSVRVYDLSGRLVLNAENQENVSLAELAEGVYTAIIDGKIIKLNK